MRKFVAVILWLLGGLSLGGTAALHAVLPSFPAPVPVPYWTHETVAASGKLNEIALDSAGEPHIAFVDDSTNMLRYAHRNAGTWVIVDLAAFPMPVPSADLLFDLAIDPQDDTVIVAYSNSVTNEVFLGRPVGSTWQWHRVGTGGRLLSLRIAGDGTVHLVFVDGQLMQYWTWDGATWKNETIGEPDAYVWNLFLDLDEFGQPHVAGTGANGSFHAHRLGPDDWLVEGQDLANVEAMALDPAGEPLYLLTESEELWGRPPFSRITLSLVRGSNGKWEKTTVWVAEDWYVDADLVVAADGTAHVAFVDMQNRPHYVRIDLDDTLLREHPTPYGLGQISLTLNATADARLAYQDGDHLIYARRDIVWHDKFVFVPLGLR